MNRMILSLENTFVCSQLILETTYMLFIEVIFIPIMQQPRLSEMLQS